MMGTSGISICRFRFSVILCLFFLIYYQQIFTIHIGGSLKIYECLLVVLLFLSLPQPAVSDGICFLLFFFFVICPFMGLILYYTEIVNPEGYYYRFPEARQWQRFNPWIAPILICFYDLLNWVGFNTISGSELVYKNQNRLIRVFIFSGVLVILYSFYAHMMVYRFGFPDIIPDFLDSRNARPEHEPRISGFSAEPGTFIFLLAWMLLYLIWKKHLFQNYVRWALILLVLSAIMMTSSSAILALVFAFIFCGFLCASGLVLRRMILSSLLVCSAIFMAKDHPDLHAMRYAFGEKIIYFLSGARHTNDSGAMRHYTSRLGIELLRDYPVFGVGSGNSYFHLWQYEFATETIPTIERISHSMPPQNAHAKILAERGFLGYGFLLAFFFSIVMKFRRKRREGNISSSDFFLGITSSMMFFLMMFSVYPVYSFFLWINTALLNNQLNFCGTVTGDSRNE
ncbi:MAG: O-antigen ligase family protein [Deltaproteobacteria bacterium]|nr:O-antigen ligase family protein [Deltaproteobacteria bacterium]